MASTERFYVIKVLTSYHAASSLVFGTNWPRGVKDPVFLMCYISEGSEIRSALDIRNHGYNHDSIVIHESYH
jgi:hypothetical protein